MQRQRSPGRALGVVALQARRNGVQVARGAVVQGWGYGQACVSPSTGQAGGRRHGGPASSSTLVIRCSSPHPFGLLSPPGSGQGCGRKASTRDPPPPGRVAPHPTPPRRTSQPFPDTPSHHPHPTPVPHPAPRPPPPRPRHTPSSALSTPPNPSDLRHNNKQAPQTPATTCGTVMMPLQPQTPEPPYRPPHPGLTPRPKSPCIPATASSLLPETSPPHRAPHPG